MRKVVACALLTTTTLFPAAFQPTGLMPVEPVSPAAWGLNHTSLPVSEMVKVQPDQETRLVVADGFEYKISEDERSRWEMNHRVIVEGCNHNDLIAKDLAAFLLRDDKRGKLKGIGRIFIFGTDVYRAIQETNNERVEGLQRRNSVCPFLYETIESYLAQARHFNVQEPGSELKTSDLNKDEMWCVTWSTQRYLLAMSIELGLLNQDEELKAECLGAGETTLDRALAYYDDELALWLWNRGARNMTSSKEDLKLLMLRSFDERSVQVLKDLQNDMPYSDTWLIFEWATDLDPELVRKKVCAILEIPDEDDYALSKYCVPRSLARNIPGDSKGALALREYAVSKSAWFDCYCAIL